MNAPGTSHKLKREISPYIHAPSEVVAHVKSTLEAMGGERRAAAETAALAM